jgi:hypothetical protein
MRYKILSDGSISSASDDPVLRGERARAGVAGAHSQSMALSPIPWPTSRLLNLVARSRPVDRDDALALHTMVKRRSEECVSLSRIRWRLAASGSGLSLHVDDHPAKKWTFNPRERCLQF